MNSNSIYLTLSLSITNHFNFVGPSCSYSRSPYLLDLSFSWLDLWEGKSPKVRISRWAIPSFFNFAGSFDYDTIDYFFDFTVLRFLLLTFWNCFIALIALYHLFCFSFCFPSSISKWILILCPVALNDDNSYCYYSGTISFAGIKSYPLTNSFVLSELPVSLSGTLSCLTGLKSFTL